MCVIRYNCFCYWRKVCPTCELLPYFDILGERFLLWTSRNVWSNILVDSLCQFYGSPQILCPARSSVVTKCQTGQPKEVSNKCQWVSRPPILWIALIGSNHAPWGLSISRIAVIKFAKIGKLEGVRWFLRWEVGGAPASPLPHPPTPPFPFIPTPSSSSTLCLMDCSWLVWKVKTSV